MAKNRKLKVVKRPSKAEVHTLAVAKSYAHASSSDIQRRQSSVEYEITLLEAELTELEMKVKDARALKAEHEASLAGLRRVTAGR